MSELHVRSDSVDVEQIMKQIRARIREKRGADYTDAELQQLASVKLEQFADPSALRSDLLEQFRQRSHEPSTYHRHRGPRRLDYSWSGLVTGSLAGIANARDRPFPTRTRDRS